MSCSSTCHWDWSPTVRATEARKVSAGGRRAERTIFSSTALNCRWQNKGEVRQRATGNSHLWYAAGNPGKCPASRRPGLVKLLVASATGEEGWWVRTRSDFTKKLLRRNLVRFKRRQLHSSWKAGCFYWLAVSEVCWHLPKLRAHELWFICIWKGQGEEEGRTPHRARLLRASSTILELRRLGSPFLWFLSLFLTPLRLDPAEPERASGKGGLSVALPCPPLLVMPPLKAAVPQWGLATCCCYFLTALPPTVSVFPRKRAQF